MTWKFTLSGEILDRVSWKIDEVPIGRKISSGIILIEPTSNFQEHFNISASDPATLIIHKVTEADEAVFKCLVESNIRTWADEIQVKIGGESFYDNYISIIQSNPQYASCQCYYKLYKVNSRYSSSLITSPAFYSGLALRT